MARAARTCSTCPAIITNGRHCPRCERARGSATDRGYNTVGHRRFRTAVLARDPICTECRQAWSTVADHYPDSRRSLIADGLDPDDPARGRGLCKPCHDRSTAVEHSGWGGG